MILVLWTVAAGEVLENIPALIFMVMVDLCEGGRPFALGNKQKPPKHDILPRAWILNAHKR